MIDIRDAETGEPALPAFQGNDVDINDVAFSPDGSILATAGDDDALRFWDPATGEPLSSVTGDSIVVGASFDADGSLAAACWPFEDVVRIVDPSTGRVVRAIEGLRDGAFDSALSPRGDRIVVSFALISEARVYDVRSGDLLFELRGHDGPINAVSWSPDGRRIATAGDDMAVGVWEAETGELVTELLGHSGSVINVDWAPDSHRLLSTASDGVAKIWAIEDCRGSGAALAGREGDEIPDLGGVLTRRDPGAHRRPRDHRRQDLGRQRDRRRGGSELPDGAGSRGRRVPPGRERGRADREEVPSPSGTSEQQAGSARSAGEAEPRAPPGARGQRRRDAHRHPALVRRGP